MTSARSTSGRHDDQRIIFHQHRPSSPHHRDHHRERVAKSLPLRVSRFQLIPDRRRRAVASAFYGRCVCASRRLHVSAALSSPPLSLRVARPRRVKWPRGKKKEREENKESPDLLRHVRPRRRILRSRPGTPSRSIMRDMAGKIAELKFEAPLARFEEEDTASLKNMNLLTGARQTALLFFPLPLSLSSSSYAL